MSKRECIFSNVKSIAYKIVYIFLNVIFIILNIFVIIKNCYFIHYAYNNKIQKCQSNLNLHYYFSLLLCYFFELLLHEKIHILVLEEKPIEIKNKLVFFKL